MPAKLRHIAMFVRDQEESARFYETVFGLERVGFESIEGAGSAIYMSDGVVNLALLKAEGKELIGRHHFGFVVDDTTETGELIKQNGGVFHYAFGDPERHNAEVKYKDPNGISFDISAKGWVGAAN